MPSGPGGRSSRYRRNHLTNGGESPPSPAGETPAREDGRVWLLGKWWLAQDWKGGSKTQARYTRQHYNLLSARSTLGASLIQDDRINTLTNFSSENCGEWIKASTHRVSILLDVKRGPELLSLLEALLRSRLDECVSCELKRALIEILVGQIRVECAHKGSKERPVVRITYRFIKTTDTCTDRVHRYAQYKSGMSSVEGGPQARLSG